MVVPSYFSGRMFCDPAGMTTRFPCWTNPLWFGYHGIMTPPGCHDRTVRQNSCAGLGRCSESECLSQGSNNTKSLSRGTDTSATSSCESMPDKQACPISSLIDDIHAQQAKMFTNMSKSSNIACFFRYPYNHNSRSLKLRKNHQERHHRTIQPQCT